MRLEDLGSLVVVDEELYIFFRDVMNPEKRMIMRMMATKPKMDRNTILIGPWRAVEDGVAVDVVVSFAVVVVAVVDMVEVGVRAVGTGVGRVVMVCEAWALDLRSSFPRAASMMNNPPSILN